MMHKTLLFADICDKGARLHNQQGAKPVNADEKALCQLVQQIVDCAFKPIGGFVLTALDEVAQFVYTILANFRQLICLSDEL